MSGSIRNLAVMLWAMSYVKSIDQEDPHTLLYIRLAFSLYILIGLVLNIYLHHRIVKTSNQTLIKVPPKPPSPFSPPPPPPTDNDDDNKEGDPTPPKAEWNTIMEHDLSVLSATRFSWISNVLLLTGIHFKMGTLAPMVMSGVMGLNRFFDDPLVQLYVLGKPSVGKLKRPFGMEKNPMMGMLKSFLGGGEDKKEEVEGEGEGLAGEDEEEEVVEIVEVEESEGELEVANGSGEGKKDK